MDVDAITLDKSKLECFNCGRKGVPLQPSATTNSNPQMTASPTEVPPGSTQAPNPACTKEATTSTPATTALAQDSTVAAKLAIALGKCIPFSEVCN